MEQNGFSIPLALVWDLLFQEREGNNPNTSSNHGWQWSLEQTLLKESNQSIVGKCGQNFKGIYFECRFNFRCQLGGATLLFWGFFLPLERKGHPESPKQHRTVLKQTTPAEQWTKETFNNWLSFHSSSFFCVSPFVSNHFCVYYPRCLLPCVWVHGPRPNGAARIWLGTFLRGPYQVFHETVNGGAGLLSQKEFPSSRHQVLQHLTEQQVTWEWIHFSFPRALPGFSWEYPVLSSPWVCSGAGAVRRISSVITIKCLDIHLKKILWNTGLLGRVCNADDTEFLVLFFLFLYFFEAFCHKWRIKPGISSSDSCTRGFVRPFLLQGGFPHSLSGV